MTMAAASLSIAFKGTLISSPSDDEIIVIAPFFLEYRVFSSIAVGVKFTVVVASDTKNFQINSLMNLKNW